MFCQTLKTNLIWHFITSTAYLTFFALITCAIIASHTLLPELLVINIVLFLWSVTDEWTNNHACLTKRSQKWLVRHSKLIWNGIFITSTAYLTFFSLIIIASRTLLPSNFTLSTGVVTLAQLQVCHTKEQRQCKCEPDREWKHQKQEANWLRMADRRAFELIGMFKGPAVSLNMKYQIGTCLPTFYNYK